MEEPRQGGRPRDGDRVPSSRGVQNARHFFSKYITWVVLLFLLLLSVAKVQRPWNYLSCVVVLVVVVCGKSPKTLELLELLLSLLLSAAEGQLIITWIIVYGWKAKDSRNYLSCCLRPKAKDSKNYLNCCLRPKAKYLGITWVVVVLVSLWLKAKNSRNYLSCFFRKNRTNPGLFFIYFCLFKHTLQFLQQTNLENVPLENSAGIHTHNLWNMSLLS